MTGALPYRRIVDRNYRTVTVAVTDTDLSEVLVVMLASEWDTPTGEEIIRRTLARRHGNRAAAVDGGL